MWEQLVVLFYIHKIYLDISAYEWDLQQTVPIIWPKIANYHFLLHLQTIDYCLGLYLFPLARSRHYCLLVVDTKNTLQYEVHLPN